MSRSQNITCFDFSLSTDTASRLVTLNVTAQESSLSTDTATRQGTLARTAADTSTSTDTATRVVVTPPPDDLPIHAALDPATNSQSVQGHVNQLALKPGDTMALKGGDIMFIKPDEGDLALEAGVAGLELDGDEF